MLKYPCQKNNDCQATEGLNFDLLPREPFELECRACKKNVLIEPKKIFKERLKKAKQDKDNHHILSEQKKTTSLKFKRLKEKIFPMISVLFGTGFIFLTLLILIKVIFHTSLDKSKTIGFIEAYKNEQQSEKKLLLDITIDETINLKKEINEELETVLEEKQKTKKIFSPDQENSKSYSEYIQRYSKLPKNIRQVYESFNLEKLRSSRDAILIFIKNNPAQTYVGNIILSEFYTYLSAVDEKPELNRFAIDNLKELQQSYPQTAEWKRAMALALFYVRDYKASFKYIDSIAKIFQNDPVTQALYGSLTYKMKDKEQGKSLLLRAHTIFPQHYLVSDFYVNLLLEEKMFSQAASVFKSMNFSKNEHAKLLKKAILTFDHSNDWKMIVSMYEKYINEKIDLNSYFIYAKALSRQARPEKALEVFNEIEKSNFMTNSDEKTFLLFFEKAYAFYVLKNYTESIDYFLKALTVKPEHILTLRFIGNCNFRLNQFFEAIDFYEKANSLEPNALLLKNIALSYYESKQFNKSIVHFQKLLKDEPENYVYMFYLAQAYDKLGMKNEALSFAQKAQSLSSENNVQIERFILRLKQL